MWAILYNSLDCTEGKAERTGADSFHSINMKTIE